MTEIWREITGYEGIYEVSTLGRIRGLDRVLSCGRRHKGSIIKACGSAYLNVSLTKNGHATNHWVHRLVAQAFIPNPSNLPCVNHKDENKQNNCVENLEWCTYGYNNDYSRVSQKAADARRGKSLSAQHKASISATLRASGNLRAEKRRKTMQMRYPDGIVQTEESNRLRSIALKGVPKSAETRQKMCKPKSAEARENMRKAQRLCAEAKKLGMSYKEYLLQLTNIGGN